MIRRRLPPLPAVRAFEAAARLGSFTRAAAELHMTQAAVSYQIKQLEERLGLRLFQRQPRQVVLTPAGQRLATAVIDAFQRLNQAFEHLHERAETELAITALPTIAVAWLVPRLGAFQLAHPRIAVRLDTGVPLLDLEQDEFDVGIRIGAGEWPGTRADLLLPSLFTPLCSPALRERLRTPADLLALPRFGRERWWREWFVAAGIADADLATKPGMDLDVEQHAVASAIAGHGVAISSPIFFEPELAAGRLLQPFDLVMRDARDYWLAYPAARADSGKIRAFRDWLLDQAARSGSGIGAQRAPHADGRE